jgi:flagellar protein FlaF
MGAGTIVASAIVIVLLIITGYVLIGGTLSTAQITMAAQRIATEKELERLHTQIEIFKASTNAVTHQTFIEVNNTGSEMVGDFDHIDVYLLQNDIPYLYMNTPGTYNWTYQVEDPDIVHPNLLDPGEAVNITVLYNDALGDPPRWVQVTTANGVYDSAYLPKE